MRPAYLEIDLAAFAHNIGTVRRLVGPAVEIIAVVKANAYGHGTLPVARACLTAGASRLAVAIVEEGIELRQKGILAPILVMGGLIPGQAAEAVAWNLTSTVMNFAYAEALSQAAIEQNTCASVHLKIDTGMSRLGVRSDMAGELAAQLATLPALHFEGIYTHLADPTGNPEFTRDQITAFHQAIKAAQSHLGPLPVRHLLGSGGICTCPGEAMTAVRPGEMLYSHVEGLSADIEVDIHPPLTLRAPIVLMKPVRRGETVSYGCTYRVPEDTVLAILPVGYADGYPRALTGRAEVLIGGQRHRVVGRVCMDTIIVDVGSQPLCRIGDEAVLIGRQGEEEISALEIANHCQTITQDILSRLGSRLPRVYVNCGEKTC